MIIKEMLQFIRFLRRESISWQEEALRYVPGYLGVLLRRNYWRMRFKSCGVKLWVSSGVIIEGARNVEMGDEAIIGPNSHLGSAGKGLVKFGNRVATNRNVMIYIVDGNVTIGDNVLIGPNVVFVTDNHVYDRIDVPIRDQGISSEEIVIEDDVWIGANAVILPGVRIGKGAIIASGAVVSRDISPYSVAGGVPAATIKERRPSR